MANKKIGFDFVPILDINDMKKNVGQIETIFKDLKLSPNFTASIQNEFKELYKSIGNYEKNIGKSKQGTIGVKQLQTSAKEVERIYSNIVKNFQKLDRTDIVNSFKIDTTEIQQLNQQIEDISKNFTISSDTSAYFAKIQADIQNTQIKTHKWAQSLNSVNFNPLQSKNISASIEEIGEKIKEGNTQIKSYTTQLNNLKATQASLQQKKDSGIISADEEKTLNALPAKITRVSQNLDTYKRIVDNLSKIQKNFSNSQDESARKIEELRSTIKRLVEQGYNELEEGLKDAQSGAEKASDGIKEFNDNLIRVTNSTEQNARDLSNIFDQLTRFATIGGQIQILRNVIRSAYQDVKELDKVMNSIAVVSNETTKSLWNQSNAYAELASSMGTSIVGAYEVAKLYYQQGREASQITSLTTDTLKLARLAELDYADATDYMTVALNGFNMAANESINIVDVYSNLAAKAAADQSEIAIAMSKTASLANSVGMSFENTSAFLTKIIETTRESAETSGTALKTVVARFAEVKKLVSEGELTGTDSEGEAIEINKIDTALRNVGISLADFVSGSVGLDEVFDQLGRKWDTLDTATQRYIATMAAGSRQQSRFLALMQNYPRTLELIEIANNSAGASNKQFEKTQDSLESKLNKLNNAWTVFTTNIADSSTIKAAIDILTKLLETINNIVESSGKLGPALQVGIALAGAKVVAGSVAGVAPLIGQMTRGSLDEGTTIGAQLGKGILGGIKKEFQGVSKIFDSIKGYFSKGKGFLKGEASKFANVFTQDSINRTKAFTEEVGNLVDTYDDWNDTYLDGQKIFTQANVNIGEATSKITLFKTAITGLSPAIPIIAGIAAVLGVVAIAYLHATKNARALKKAQEELNEIQDRRQSVESQIAELEIAEELNDYERIKLELLKEQLETILEQERAQKRQVFEAEKTVNSAKGYGITKQEVSDGSPWYMQGPGPEETHTEYFVASAGEVTYEEALTGHNTYQEQAKEAILELMKLKNELIDEGKTEEADALQHRIDLIEKEKEEEQNQYDEIIAYYTQAWEDGILDREKDEEEFLTWQKAMIEKLGVEQSLIYFSKDKTETEQKKIIEQYQQFMKKLSLAREPRETTSILNNLSKDFPLLAEAISNAGLSYEDLIEAAKGWRAESKQQIDSIKKLTQSFNDYLSQLGKLEDQISSVTDLYKKFIEDGAVSAADLSKLGNIQIGGTDEEPILLNSIAAWEQYSSVLSNSSSTINDVKDATQKLTSELITQTDWIDFNEQKQQALVNSLKKLGVVNAQQIAEEVANRSKLTNELADIYGIDVKNYKTAKELKEAIDQKTNELIAEAEAKLTGKRKELYSEDVKNYKTASVEKLKALKKQLWAEVEASELIANSPENKTNYAYQKYQRDLMVENAKLMAKIDKIIAQKQNEIDISSLFEISTPKFDWSTFDKTTSSATAAKESVEELASVFYNLDDIINDTTNSLKNLQSEYDHLTSTESITQNLSDQISLYKKLIANTREEISVAEQLIKSYQKQAETLGYLNKYFTFSDNGSIRRTQAYYNLREKEDAAIIEALDKWINKYDELVSKQDELNQSLTDYHGELVSTWEQWRDSFISLINDLAQVYEEDAQNAIDAQKDKYDELKKLDDDYLERLKKNIQARRDARDKENQYNELAEKQSRLSLLMRDTSGMYAEEIAQLQKEITEAQQDISDSEVDAIIDKLEDEYDIQHQYWDRLIEKQQSQLDQMRENGEYLKIAEQDIRQNPDAVYEKMAAYWEDKYSQTEIVAKLEELSQSIGEAKQFLSSGASTGEEYAQNVGNQAGTSYEDQSHPNYANGATPTSISLSNGQVLEGYIKNGKTYMDKELTQPLNDYLKQNSMAAMVNSVTGKKYVMLPGMTRGAEVAEVKKFLQNKIDWVSASASKKASLNIENEKFRNTYGMGSDTIPYEDAVRYMDFLRRYKKGGLVDYTGMAWVDGSKTQPEAFLNAQDTRNLAQLKEMLAAHFNSTTNKTIGGDCNIYVNVDSISSDYDIDQAINKIKNEMVKSSSYRNVNLISRAR